MRIEEIKKIYTAYRLYIFPAVVGICCFLIIAFIIFPQTTKFILNQKEEIEIKSKIERINSKINELNSYNEQDLKIRTEEVIAVLPSDKDFAGAVGFLQQVFGQSGFVVTSIQVGSGSVEKSSDTQSYSISVEAAGPQSLVSNLINSIENSGRIMKIASLEINPTQKTEGSNVSFNINVLYSPLAVKLQSADAPLSKLTEKDNQLLAKYSILERPVAEEMPDLSGQRGRENPFE